MVPVELCLIAIENAFRQTVSVPTLWSTLSPTADALPCHTSSVLDSNCTAPNERSCAGVATHDCFQPRLGTITIKGGVKDCVVVASEPLKSCAFSKQPSLK